MDTPHLGPQLVERSSFGLVCNFHGRALFKLAPGGDCRAGFGKFQKCALLISGNGRNQHGLAFLIRQRSRLER